MDAQYCLFFSIAQNFREHYNMNLDWGKWERGIFYVKSVNFGNEWYHRRQ